MADGGGTLEAGAHGVAVVLDDEDDGQFEEGGHVEALAEDALVHGSVTEEGDRASLDPLVLEGKG